MIILKFWGGIGNQLFIYALYVKLIKIGKNVKGDISNYTRGIDIRKFELDKLGITINQANIYDYWKIQKGLKCKVDFIKAIYRKEDYSSITSYIEKQHMFSSTVLEEDNICLMGYWQDPKYFLDVIDDVRNSIIFPDYNDVESIVEKIQNEESVSIHVRLTDYHVGINKRLGDVCSHNYYSNAIERIRKNVENPVFYVFSDDITEAGKLLADEIIGEHHFIDSGDSIEDLYLMTKCKHHIIANSSYSWWGANLGCTNGVVIAPDRWIMDCDEWDPTLDSWTKLSSG